MSQPVRIPSRRGVGAYFADELSSRRAASASASPSSIPSLPYSMSYSPAARSSSAATNSPSPLRQSLSPETPSSAAKEQRRSSLMSSSLAASEHTVINVGHPDGPPRLITCVRSSQGFDWNQEIFLPSHYDHLYSSPDLECKKDPVHDIHLTDEDLESVFPQ